MFGPVRKETNHCKLGSSEVFVIHPLSALCNECAVKHTKGLVYDLANRAGGILDEEEECTQVCVQFTLFSNHAASIIKVEVFQILR